MTRVVTAVVAVLAVVCLGAWLVVASASWYPDARLGGHRATVIAVALNDDGARLASLDAAGELRLWDVHTRETLHAMRLPLTGTHLALVPEHTALTLSPDGTTAALATPVTGTTIWRPGDEVDWVVIPLDGARPWMLALSNDNGMLATLDTDAELHTWDVRRAEHIARMSNPGFGRLIDVLDLRFVEGDWALRYYRDWAGRLPVYVDARSGVRLHYKAHTSGVAASSSQPLGFKELSLWVREVEVDLMVTTLGGEPVGQDRARYPFLVDTEPIGTRFGGTVITEVPNTDWPVALDTNGEFLAAETALGRLTLWRPTKSGDLWRWPHPYLAGLLLLLVLIWRGRVHVLHGDGLPAEPQTWRNAEPLPVSLQVAAFVLMAVGMLAFMHMIAALAVGDFSLNVAALLVVAGWRVRRRREGWRKFSVVCVWLGLLGGGLLLGVAGTGQWTAFRLGPYHSELPPWQDGVIALAVIAGCGWLLWALSRQSVRLIFQAAKYDTRELDPLRRCEGCGYDVRATVAGGGHACPECGLALEATTEARRQVAEAFQREAGG